MLKTPGHTFADFVVLARPVPGEARELLLAARVVDDGVDERVHLLRVAGAGDDVALQARFLAAARASRQAAADRAPAILEIGVAEGDVYAVAPPVEGVALDALLADDVDAGRKPFLPFCLAVATELARIVESIHERGDVWEDRGGASLAAALPAGLTPASIVVGADGQVRVRALSSWADARAERSPFRAGKPARGGAGLVKADVWSVGKALHALLAGDVDGARAPRKGAGRALEALLRAALDDDADMRIDAIGLRERLEELLYEARPRSTHELIAEVLHDRWPGFVPDERTAVNADRAAVQRVRRRRARGDPAPVVLFPTARDADDDTIPPDALSRTDVALRAGSAASVDEDADVFVGAGAGGARRDGAPPSADATLLLDAGRAFATLPSLTDPEDVKRPVHAARNVRPLRGATPSRDFSKPEGSRGEPAAKGPARFTRVDPKTVMLEVARPLLATSQRSVAVDETDLTATGPGRSRAPTSTSVVDPKLSELPSIEPGTLVVDAPPGSVVFVNGTELGRGDLVLRGLDRFARYVVRVHKAGCAPWSAVVSLGGKPSAKVKPKLLPR